MGQKLPSDSFGQTEKCVSEGFLNSREPSRECDSERNPRNNVSGTAINLLSYKLTCNITACLGLYRQ